MIPHHKKGNTQVAGNYRPVCHLVEVGKVVELMVWDQLQEHCNIHGIIHDNHHGSTTSHDCVTAVGQIQDAGIRAVEDKKMTAVVMWDQTAAFELVDQGLLLSKMEAFNFHQFTIKWFGSYLGGRWFSVRVESATSEPRPLGDKGVPQDSILSPSSLC